MMMNYLNAGAFHVLWLCLLLLLLVRFRSNQTL